MSYRPLPRIVVGTSHMGSVLPSALVPRADREKGFALLDGLEAMGCTALDLAASYQVGGTEQLIGAWMESRRNRDRLCLISKGGHPIPLVDPHRLHPKALRADLTASLKRLKTDRLDLYLLHRDDPTEPLERLLETMSGFVHEGKILTWGVSNWEHGRIAAAVALARSNGLPEIAASSPQFALVGWERPPYAGCVSIAGSQNAEARAYYEREKLPVLAWSPLGSGFFAEREAARRASERTYATPENLARRGRAESLATKIGVSVTEVALAYLFSQPFPVSAVIGTRTVDHMRRNLGAVRLTLGADELRFLDVGDRSPVV